MNHVATVPDLLWKPGADRVARSAMARFLQRIRDSEAASVHDYEDLWQWSVDQPERFWPLLAEYFGIDQDKLNDEKEAMLEEMRKNPK